MAMANDRQAELRRRAEAARVVVRGPDEAVVRAGLLVAVAGLASEGYKPFCAIYSTFLQRAYDQVVHDVAIQNLPVRFAIDRAGLVGADGATHAGAFDVAYLACLPNMVVMAAARPSWQTRYMSWACVGTSPTNTVRNSAA